MSQHSSLKSSKTSKKHRSVLKRYEKFFTLKEKGVLKEDASVFGMPKLKIVRAKIKKEKAEEKPEEALEGAQVEGATAQKEVAGKTEKAGRPEKKEKEKEKK